MANRIIRDNFWTDSRVEDLDPIEKLLYLYLISNPLCNIAGIYDIKAKRIAYETGIDRDMVNKLLDRFVEYDKILRFEDRIIIKNFAKNQSKNPSVVIGMQRVIDSVPLATRQGFDRLYTGCIQSLTYFTLLNLTLPNFTLLNSTEKSDEVEEEIFEEEEEVIEKTPNLDVYDTIKKHAGLVDGTIFGCVELTKNLGKLAKHLGTESTEAEILDNIIVAMKEQGQDQFYSIANPISLNKNLSTIYNKIKASINKKNGKELKVY